MSVWSGEGTARGQPGLTHGHGISLPLEIWLNIGQDLLNKCSRLTLGINSAQVLLPLIIILMVLRFGTSTSKCYQRLNGQAISLCMTRSKHLIYGINIAVGISIEVGIYIVA